MNNDLIYLLIGIGVLIFILLIARAIVWWYFGIYEFLDRLDKNNNLLTDIREILRQYTDVKINDSDIKEEY